MTVLAVVAAALGVVGELMLPRGSIWSGGAPRLLLVWGPAIIAVGLVPLLTLLTRKPLGGVVFSVVIPGAILLVTEWLNPRLDEAHALTIAWYGTVIASAFGLAALAYAFPRVETAGDDRSPGSLFNRRVAQTGESSDVLTRTAPVKRHWLWFAVTNELRLQQLTLVVSALFVLIGGVIVLLQRAETPYTGPGVGALTALHGIFIAIIAGSRASAEQRHIGILAAQALQPKAAWKTWAVKVTMTLGLALVLAVALPWLFRLVDADAVHVRVGGYAEVHPALWWFGLERAYFAGVVLTTIAALYVSSLSSNSLWALLACFPTGVACVAFAGTVLTPVRRWVFGTYMYAVWDLMTPAMRASDQGYQVYRARLDVFRAVEQYTSVTLVLGLSLLLLYLASRNHHSLERGRAVMIRQVGTIAIYLVAATALYVAAGRIAWWL
jgi:hypothetical protein